MNTFLTNLKKNTLCLSETVYVYLLFLTMETRMAFTNINRAKQKFPRLLCKETLYKPDRNVKAWKNPL